MKFAGFPGHWARNLTFSHKSFETDEVQSSRDNSPSWKGCNRAQEILSLIWGHLTPNVQKPKITLKTCSKTLCHTLHPPSVSTDKMSAFKQFTNSLSTCRCWLLRSQQTCAQLLQFAQPRGQPWPHPHWYHLALHCLHHMVLSQVAKSTFNRTIWNTRPTFSDNHCYPSWF